MPSPAHDAAPPDEPPALLALRPEGGPNEACLPELHCACAALRRASRALTQAYDEHLRPLGLRSTQLILLKALDQAGPTPQGRLGRWLLLDATTMSRTSRVLEREGWIQSGSSPDRRERILSLTSEGRGLLIRATPLWEAAQTRLKRTLGPEGWADLFSQSQTLVDLLID